MKWSVLFSVVTIANVSGNVGLADVIFWNDHTRDRQAEDSTVLHYDSTGNLIRSSGQYSQNDIVSNGDAHPNPGGETDAATLATPSEAQGTRMAAALPLIRVTTARYADHAALEMVDLTPRDWAFLFQALVRAESGFNSDAVSPAGARGLAQLMPDTARSLGVIIDDPHDNLDGGARYLLTQIETFGSLDLALAAYNAGPEAVRNYGGIPPFAETRAYVVRVLAEFDRLRAVSSEGTPL